jgi:hypothetical protein
MHHINESSLKECFYQLSGGKAVGVDGVTKAEYEPGGEGEGQSLPSLCNQNAESGCFDRWRVENQ